MTSNSSIAGEDLAIDLAGILIAPTFPYHKSKRKQQAWFRYWERLSTKSIKSNIKKKSFPKRS
jgi:hypothetical protein